MGVSKSEIETALTKRFMNTRGEEFTIFLKPNEARDGCDALAKEVSEKKCTGCFILCICFEIRRNFFVLIHKYFFPLLL
jgi:hypothetical protein